MNKTKVKITCGIILVLFICSLILIPIFNKDKKPQDLNVYLNEEVRFADEVFIKVVGLSVDKTETSEHEFDEDGDKLSEYTLNLLVSIAQRNTDNYINKITMKSEMFTLKSVNLKSKSKMQVFFNSLATITLQTSIGLLVGGTVDGSLKYGVMDAIETGIDFATEYTTQYIENAETLKTDFKPIKATKNQFKPFNPRDNMNEATIVKLSFPIKQEYLDSENIMVLTVDKIDKFEKRIFLIPRPINTQKDD